MTVILCLGLFLHTFFSLLQLYRPVFYFYRLLSARIPLLFIVLYCKLYECSMPSVRIKLK